MDSYEKIYRTVDRLAEAMPGRIGKDFGTWGEVFDTPTVMTLHKFLRNDVLKSIDYPVATGKEANVFKATLGDGDDCAVKIYRVHTATFRHMMQYVEGDPRFRKVPREHRALIHAWAKKEFRNLDRYREAGVDVPIPYKCLNNCVVMEYLAREDGPARTMKQEPPADAEAAYQKLWNDYTRLVRQARSIHADFSEYNVLMVGGQPRIIDVAQGVLDSHPMVAEFLRRDLHNFAKFFQRMGVDVDEDALVEEASGILHANADKELKLEEL